MALFLASTIYGFQGTRRIQHRSSFIESFGSGVRIKACSRMRPRMRLKGEVDLDMIKHRRDDSKSHEGKFSKVSKAQAVVLLTAVTVLWGSQHAVIKLAVEASGSPAELTLARFGIAAVLFAPWLPPFTSGPNAEFVVTSSSANSDDDEDGTSQRSPASVSTAVTQTWLVGAELGVWMFLGYALQAVALETTSASRSAFLLYLNVKLVPLFAWVFTGRVIQPRTWASAATALAGTCLLANDGAPPNVGDLWSVLAACASAAFILRLEAAVMPTTTNEPPTAAAMTAPTTTTTTTVTQNPAPPATVMTVVEAAAVATAVETTTEETTVATANLQPSEGAEADGDNVAAAVTACSLVTVACLAFVWAMVDIIGSGAVLASSSLASSSSVAVAAAVASASASAGELLTAPPSSPPEVLTSLLSSSSLPSAFSRLCQDLSLLMAPGSGGVGGWAVLYLAVVTTALTSWLQAIGQSAVAAEEASLIYALDPLWGAMFAAVLCGDRFGPQGIAGGVLVLAAAAFSSSASTQSLEERPVAEEDRKGGNGRGGGGGGVKEIPRVR